MGKVPKVIEMKVLVGIPLPYGISLEKVFLNKIKALGTDLEVFVVQDTEEESKKGDKIYRVMKAREKIREYFLSKDFSHLLFIDSDIDFPQNTLEILLSYDKDMIMHSYKKRIGHQIVMTGFGCTLIKRKVLENVSILDPQIKEGLNHVSEDTFFLKNVYFGGFSIVLLSNVLNIKHSKPISAEDVWKWVAAENQMKMAFQRIPKVDRNEEDYSEKDLNNN